MIRTTLAPGAPWPYGDAPVILLKGQAKRSADRRQASNALLSAVAQNPGISTAELAKMTKVSVQHTWFCTTLLIDSGRLTKQRVQIGKRPPHDIFYLSEPPCGMH